MAGNDAVVKVRLDTRQASGDLRGLVQDATRTAGRVGEGVRNAVGRGLGAVGLGGGIGVGLAALRGPSQSSASDIITETLRPFGVQLEKFLFGDLSIEARAKKHAREEFKESFSFLVPEKGPIPNSLKNLYNQMVSVRERHEAGARAIDSDPFFGGGIQTKADMKEFAGMITDGLGYLLRSVIRDLGLKAMEAINQK
jgi:hypothetical protein